MIDYGTSVNCIGSIAFQNLHWYILATDYPFIPFKCVNSINNYKLAFEKCIILASRVIVRCTNY